MVKIYYIVETKVIFGINFVVMFEKIITLNT